MKLIKAYIRPEMFEKVHWALKEEGYTSMTVTRAEGVGSYSDPENRHGSLEFPMMHSKVVSVEMISENDHVDVITDIIREHASTGHPGDGLITVLPIGQSIRVRDGEQRNYRV